MDKIDQIKEDLDNYLDQIKNNLNYRRIVYVHAKERFELEIDDKVEVPDDL